MSDDEDSFGEDDYFEFEDLPFNQAEDLAAHSLPSPVWINYDPAWELASPVSDWEYYSDGYWDRQSSKKRARDDDLNETKTATETVEKPSKKRQKVKTAGKPTLDRSQPPSTVVWRSGKEISETNSWPIIAEGQLEKVSILQDWKKRFQPSKVPKATEPNSKSSFKADDLVGDQVSYENDEESGLSPPPMNLEEPETLRRDLPTKGPVRVSPVENIGTLLLTDEESVIPESDSDQRMPELGVNGVGDGSVHQNRMVGEAKESFQTIQHRRRKRPGRDESPDKMDKTKSENIPELSAGINGLKRKRKAGDELQENVTLAAIDQPRKRGRPRKQNPTDPNAPHVGSTSRQVLSVVIPAQQKRSGPNEQQSPLNKPNVEPDSEVGAKAEPEIPVIAHKKLATGRKRKEQSSEDELSKPPPKRQFSVKDGSVNSKSAGSVQSKTQRNRKGKRG